MADAEGNMTFTNKETVAVSRTKASAAASETAAPDADKTQGSPLQANLPKEDKVFFAVTGDISSCVAGMRRLLFCKHLICKLPACNRQASCAA